MQRKWLVVVALVGVVFVGLGTPAGDAGEADRDKRKPQKYEHRRHTGGDVPLQIWGEDVYQTFEPGSGENSARRKSNFGARRWSLYKRGTGQIGGADRIVVYDNSPGDAIARSAVVYGMAPTNATGDEGVELDRAEIWNFAQVPMGKLAEPARKGSTTLRVLLDRSDHSRFLGEDQLVVLSGRARATRVRGMDATTRDWLVAPGASFDLEAGFDSFAFALDTSSYRDRADATVMDWLEAQPGQGPAKLRTLYLSQGRDIGAPPWYSREGIVAHTALYAPGVRTGYTAPAFRIAGLTVPTLESGESAGFSVELVLSKPLTSSLPRGEPIQVHSGGPPHATFFDYQLAWCRRGGHCYGNMITSAYSNRPVEFAYATHSIGADDYNTGFAFETALRSRFSHAAIEHWYETDARGYDRKRSTVAMLRAEQGWGQESYGLVEFLGRNTRLEFDSKAGVLRLVVDGKRYRLEMEPE